MQVYFPTVPFSGKLVHVGVSGSIAAYRTLDIVRALSKAGLRVTVALTHGAMQFVTPLSFRALGAETVYSDVFSGAVGQMTEGFDPFGHLAPGAKADAFAIVPASANTLHRLARGAADEILSAQALAYSGSMVIAPAMNPRMWVNPATKENCVILKRHGHVIVPPGSGEMACGDEGSGKLADVSLVYLEILKKLSLQDLSGRKVMVTLGPTCENFDGARFISNNSSGLMGASLAVAAYLRGADVHAVCGPRTPWLPPDIHRYDIITAREMFNVSQGLWAGMDIGVFTAAVSDFSPETYGTRKLKKETAPDGLSVKLTANPDILTTLGRDKSPEQLIIGFAAETDDLEESLKKKLLSKNADLMVGNKIGLPDSGFAGVCNTVILHDRSGKMESLPTMPKADLAWRILDWLPAR